jgi:hypothetical protein
MDKKLLHTNRSLTSSREDFEAYRGSYRSARCMHLLPVLLNGLSRGLDYRGVTQALRATPHRVIWISISADGIELPGPGRPRSVRIELCRRASSDAGPAARIVLRLRTRQRRQFQSADRRCLAAAGAALWFLLPHGQIDFFSFAAVFSAATAVGVISRVPGGLGVFDVVIFLVLRRFVPSNELVAALLIYRGVSLLPATARKGGLSLRYLKKSCPASG